MPQQIANALEASPMYNLSLSSKELFHSNFLAWLGNNDSTKQFFVDVINELVEDLNLQLSGDWTVKREDDHFDLSIKENGDKGKYLLVIENKVKSLPRKTQLNDYISKNIKGKDEKTKFLLLTLVDRYPDKPINGWQKMTYEKLAKIMNEQYEKNTIKDQYERSLIEDYISFTQNLDKLVKVWNNETVFAQKMSVDLPKLEDLHTKLQFGRYCTELREKIRVISKDIVVYDDNDIPADADKDNKVYLKVYWDYASLGKDGILDVEIPVTSFKHPKIVMGLNKDDKSNPITPYNIKIQVQGRSYRHVLETNIDFAKAPVEMELIEIGSKSPYTDPAQLNYFSKDPLDMDLSIPDYGNNDIFENKPRRLYPVNLGNKKNQIPADRWPFASYKEKGIRQFIYQSRKITEGTLIDQVLNNIVDEVIRILVFLNVPIP